MSNEFLEHVFSKIALKLNIKDYAVTIKSGNKKGDGYMGEITFLELLDKTKNETHSLIIKRAFASEAVRKNAPVKDSYVNEVNVYNNVLPILQKFALDIGVEVFDEFPKCYLSSLVDGEEFLVLEDLKSLGYMLFEKTKIVPWDHMVLIFRTYAKLHAISFLHKKLRREEHQKLKKSFVDILDTYAKDEQFPRMVKDTCKMAGEKLIPGIDDEIIEKWRKYMEGGMEELIKSMEYGGEYSVFCHGDCWSNNMLFQYQDDVLKGVKLIDWQLFTEGPVALDLSYALYSGASTETFDRLDELLDIYYEKFSSIFHKVGEKPPQLDIIKKEWKRYAIFGVVLGIMIIKIKTTKYEDLLDYQDMGENEFNEEIVDKMLQGTDSEEFDRRVRELLLHCHKIDCL